MTTTKLLSLTLLLAATVSVSAEEVKDSTSTQIVSVEDSDLRNEEALRVAVGDFDDVEFLLSADEMATIANSADVGFNDISAQGGERSGSSMFSAEASERVETTQSASSTFNGALTLASATNTSETVTVRQSAVATMSLSFDDSTEQYAVELQSLDKGRDGVGTLISSGDSSVSKGTVSFLGNFDSIGYTDGSYGISTLSVGGVTLDDPATYTWTGGGADNYWTTAGNWDLNTAWVEGSDAVFPYYSGDDNVTITNTEVTISGEIVAGTVTIGDTYTFTVEENASLSMDLQPGTDPHLTIAGSGTVTITNNSFSLEGLLTIAGSTVTFNDISLKGGTLEVTGGKVIFNQATTSITGDGTIDISGGDAEFTGIVNIGGSESKGTISIGSKDETTGEASGGTVTFDGTVNIGYTTGTSGGTGELIIYGGTNTFVGAVNIGYSNSSSGILTISGGTNTFSSTVYIDYSGNTGTTGELDISGGTNTFDGNVYISHNANSNRGGSMTISGGTNTFNGLFEVGEQKKGTLTITGGETYFRSTYIVGGSGSSTVTISGDGTTVTFGTNSGSSTTTVSIGYSSGGTGELDISGGTVKFGATGGSGTTNVVVGNAGSATGIINITGGTVTFGTSSSSRKTNVYVGGNTNTATATNGTITISGGSVTFTEYSTLYVGNSGTGKLEIKDDATVSFNGAVYVGGNTSSSAPTTNTGTITISTGKATTFKDAVYVGYSSTGNLTITGGSNTFSSTLYLGNNSSASGTVTISGTEDGNEKNTFTGQVRIGHNGTGSLTLENATNTFSDAVYLGYNSSGNGTLTLTSGDTTFSGAVYVGNSGTGKLDITGGTAIFSKSVTVGSGSSASSVNISGGTATFNGNLTVKTGSTFSVGDGAQATIANVKVDLASAISNSGTIYLDDGVTFVLNDSLITASDDTSTTYTLISISNGGTIVVGEESSWSDLTINNFSGPSLGHRQYLDLSTAGSVTIVTAPLVWTGVVDGNASTTWVNSSDTLNWILGGTTTPDYFINGDDVTFDSTSDYRTVSIGEAIVAGTVTVDSAAYTWAFSEEGNSVTADSLTLTGTDASLTITGNGEFDLGNTSGDPSLAGAGSITVSDGATLKLVAGGDDEYEDENITITVGSGGTLDVDGDGGTMFKLVLDGGTLTSSADVSETKKQLPSITLTADSTVDATNNLGMIGGSYGATSLDLGNHTLTKTGSGNFFLYNTTVSAGTIDVTAGTLELYGTDASAATVVVAEGATLYVGNNNGSYSKVGVLTSEGTVDLKAGSTLEITGNSTISGTLSIETSSGNSSTLKVTGGANLTLNVSSATVGAGSSLSIEGSSSLTLNTSLAFNSGSGNTGDVAFSSSASLIINQSVFDGVVVEEGAEVAVAIISANTITFGDVELSDSGTLDTFTNNNITVESGTYVVTGWSYSDGTLYAIVAMPEPSMFGMMFGFASVGLVATRRRRRKAA